MTEIRVAGESALPEAAKAFLSQLGEKRVVQFSGQMGAGKTTFIRELLQAMGIAEPDGSPTYSIVNAYESDSYGTVFHFDVYRLESVEEAVAIGTEEMLDSGAYCFIEWGEKIAELLPPETVEVSISVDEDGSRLLTII
jgi:tRNA threonylcarbamoyladenosine biosynthesis protein TsaE